MSGILGVDLSLSCTGWAWLSREWWDDRPDRLNFQAHDVIRTTPADPPIIRYARIASVVTGLAMEKNVDAVAIEGYSYGSPLGAIAAGELGGIVRYSLWGVGATVTVWAVKSWRKMAFGDGNLQKDALRLALFKRYGIEPFKADAVEALGIAFAEGAARYTPRDRLAKYQLEVLKGRNQMAVEPVAVEDSL